MSELKLSAQPRAVTGRKVRQLRREGLVPVVVYGKDREPVNLQVNARHLDLTLHQGGVSQLVQVVVDGGATHNVLVREVQRHPLTHQYLHADFYAVNMNEKQEVSVALTGVGKPEALVAGLMLLQTMDHVMISALPSDIPGGIEVDVASLDVDRPITIADLPAVPGVEYLGDPGEQLFTLIAVRVQEEEEEVEVEEEMAEPEVVGHGREDEEEEE